MSRTKRRPRYPRSAEKFGCRDYCIYPCGCKREYRRLLVRRERYEGKRETRAEAN